MRDICSTHEEIIEMGKEVLKKQRGKKFDAVSHMLQHYESDYRQSLEGQKLLRIFEPKLVQECPICGGHVFGRPRGFFHELDFKPICLRCWLDKLEKDRKEKRKELKKDELL